MEGAVAADPRLTQHDVNIATWRAARYEAETRRLALGVKRWPKVCAAIGAGLAAFAVVAGISLATAGSSAAEKPAAAKATPVPTTTAAAPASTVLTSTTVSTTTAAPATTGAAPGAKPVPAAGASVATIEQQLAAIRAGGAVSASALDEVDGQLAVLAEQVSGARAAAVAEARAAVADARGALDRGDTAGLSAAVSRFTSAVVAYNLAPA